MEERLFSAVSETAWDEGLSLAACSDVEERPFRAALRAALEFGASAPEGSSSLTGHQPPTTANERQRSRQQRDPGNHHPGGED